MHKICLSLPTNRACAAAIWAMAEEAAYAAETFDVQVCLLILDSSDDEVFAGHAKVISRTPAAPNVEVVHLNETDQLAFLQEVISRAGLAKPDLILDLMLPDDLSYGACTNRAFLIGSALGCRSVHRRDSDSGYQVLNGKKVFPIHHELTSLGKRAIDAVTGVSRAVLDLEHGDRPVSMVGSSFIGELSVDIAEIRRLDPEIYYDVVSLWAPTGWPEARKRDLVDESFTGAGTEPFTYDHATLGIVDPMRVDMSNIGFFQVHEDIPLPPGTNTIGSDYFLIHVVHDAALPGVLHNRNIVNFHTPERKTGPGFVAYQLRLTKFFLSMLYFHYIYDRMAAAGDTLLDERHRVRPSMIAEFARGSVFLDKAENEQRLDSLDHAYRQLGGRYAEFADFLVPQRQRLLTEAQNDIENFALLIESWEPLIQASKTTSVKR